ncbi:MAG: beta-ketoacyl synthase N-terminal-like domain-containing protein, partial [Balneolaceae bacterium]
MTDYNSGQAVFVDGVRTPFLRAGTNFKNMSAYDIGRLAIGGLFNKTKLDGNLVDHVIMGNVIQDILTSNVARECTLGAGLPDHIPAHTISLACISSNRAVTDAVNAISSGKSKVVIAGGTEIMSDIPIRFRKKFRQKLLETQKYKSPLDYLKFFKGLKLSDFLPEIPSIAEYSTGETMGESCDKMSAKFGISRQEEDEYALRSHKLAAEAAEKGYFDEEIIPVPVPPGYQIIDSDNGVRGDSTLEKLQSLRP